MSKPTMTQAVMEKYDTIAGLPKLYNEELPEDAPQLPAAYFLHHGETPIAGAYNTAATMPSMIEGRFDIAFLATGGVVPVEALALALMAAFTPMSLSLDNSQTAVLFRTGYTCTGTKLRDRAGNQVYLAQISYLCKIGKPSV